METGGAQCRRTRHRDTMHGTMTCVRSERSGGKRFLRGKRHTRYREAGFQRCQRSVRM